MDRTLFFCPHCGFKTGFPTVHPVFCVGCGGRVPADDASFCPACGEPLRGGTDAPGLTSSTQPRGLVPLVRSSGAILRLTVLDDLGGVVREIPIDREETVVGRWSGDVRFDDDETLSAEHAVLTWGDHGLTVRDLGSANGSWLFITAPHELADGDVLLLGSQVIRFRRLPSRFEDGRDVVQPGSRLPVDDDAIIEQLRADGSVRDVLFLSPGRTILIGRDHGDWVFPYDPTMSSRHAEVRSYAQRDVYVVRDTGSRNGVAVLVRGERAVQRGERLLFGRKMLRVDLE